MAPALILHEKAVQQGRVITIKFFDILARENNTRVLNISLIVTEFTYSNDDLSSKLKSERRIIFKKVTKGVWGMPRVLKAMKDVISCDKLRGLAHTR